MIKLYGNAPNSNIINTQYGDISYLDWLSKEKNRIEKDPKREAQIRNIGNSCSLYVNEVKGCSCEACRKVFGG